MYNIRGFSVSLVCASALAPACGRIGYDPGAAPTGPFSAPVLVAELSDPEADDDDPTVTADLLELYFESNRRDWRGDIFVSRRQSPLDRWGPPEVVEELSTPDNDEETPEVSADGLMLFFASDRPGGPGFSDIYMSTRASRDLPWEPPRMVPELSSPSGDGAASPDLSLLHIVFHSGRPDNRPEDLYEASRSSVDDPWGVAEPISELDTDFSDATPFLTDDGLTLYFASDRLGGAGGHDLYVTTRPSRDAPFDPPSPVTELNTASDVEDPWLSPAGDYITFVDNREGTYDLYEAHR